MKNKIKTIIAGGLIATLLPIFIEFLYYKYMPVETFIEYQDFDIQDYSKSKDELEVIFIYRNSKVASVADFAFKYKCNGIFNNDFGGITKDVVLQKTEGLEKIVMFVPINKNIPVGECKVFIGITFNIKGYQKEINLVDNFIVHD